MKQQGNCVTGDMNQVDKYTSKWPSIRLHPTAFYRRLNEIQENFRSLKGLYTEIDMGQFVLIRFAEKTDMIEFYKRYYNSI